MNRKITFKSIYKLYKRIFRMLLEVDSKSLFSIILLQLIIGVIPSITVLVMQHIVNGIQDTTIPIKYICVSICGYISLGILGDFLNKFVAYISFIYRNKVNLNLSLLILNKTESLDLQDFEDTNIYNMIQRAQSQSENTVFEYFFSIITLATSVITIFTNVIILLAWRIWIVILVFIVSILKTLVMIKYTKKQYEIVRNRSTEERQKWYYQFLLTNDIAFKEIKIYKLSSYFINKFRNLFIKFFKQDKKINIEILLAEGSIEFIDNLVLGLIFILSILDAKIGYILIGDAMAYITSTSNIKGGLKTLSQGVVNFAQQTLYINQIFEFIDLKLNIKEEESKKIIINNITSIKIEHLFYKYKNSDSYVLNDINLELKKGDIISFVGKNGSGKSTLVKIISGFYDDYEGNIFVNGFNLRSIDKNSYRDVIGILFQDYTRYELSVRENVSVGNIKEINNDNKIKEALSLTGIDKLFPLDGQLGYWFENGTELSGGQWIKIAISRTFMRNACLYILDEPNASLDSLAEKKIFENYKELVRDKIGIIVTHRFSNAKFLSNKIAIIDKGEITSIGTHEELIRESNIYREMYNSDTVGSEELNEHSAQYLD